VSKNIDNSAKQTESIMTAYHTKHRPTSFKTVKGQEQACSSLERVLKKGTSQAFLLSGPSGCGKTTLARIAASVAGVEAGDVIDVDAATNSGADETRKLQEIMSFRPIGGGEKRAIVIDECHGLSQKAWDTLLKTIEEPNQHSLWFLCTTNPAKVPKTIMTRCTHVKLRLLKDSEVESVINRVCKREEIELEDSVRDVIVSMAYGSARQALVNLAAAEHCTTSKEAREVLHAAAEGDPIRDLCQFLLKPGSWMKAMAIVSRFDEEDRNYEGRRIIVCNYMGAVLRGAKSDDAATKALQILEAWSTPYNSSEGIAPFMLSIGRTLYAE
jgi:DNA polymerase III gamma/tau subunit